MLAQYYKLCGLKQQKIIPPQFWRLEVWIYGVTRGTASRGLRGECTACYFQLLVAVWHLLVWQFSLSTWPRDGSQWFNQTLKKMLPWRYFVDVVNIYHQVTLRLPLRMCSPCLMSWGLMSKKWDFPEKKKFKTEASTLAWVSRATVGMSDGLASPHNHVSQFLKIKFMHTYLFCSVSLEKLLMQCLSHVNLEKGLGKVCEGRW